MNIITYHLGIEVTKRCNLDCRHCFRGDSEDISITREVLEKIFDEVKYAYMLDLSGGEVFLAYDELKMLVDIIKEKKVIIDNVSMFTNGTVYDSRIYKLLDDNFKYYQVAISDDDFHDKSIKRIYKDNIDTVIKNMSKHFSEPQSLGFVRGSMRLINNGRARVIDTPKKDFLAMGYYYFVDNDYCFAGPMIFIGSDGYISDINSEYNSRDIMSIGNILDTTIYDSLVRGGILVDNRNDWISFFEKKEEDYFLHKGDYLTFKDNKMAYTEYNPDYKYLEALNNLDSDIEHFCKAAEDGKIDEFFSNWDPVYDGDLSQIEHQKVLFR